jgi:hypothetical protein
VRGSAMLTARFARRRKRVAGAAFAIAATAVLMPSPAGAHFILDSPACWMSQDGAGAPEKMGPCGDEGGGTPTGKVTPFHPGDTITVTIREVVAHPGHYRVALAVSSRSELVSLGEPVVTPTPTDACASAAIETPPVFPVLADGLLVHTQPFSGAQTVQVTLPNNVTCTKCTLQVLEFMSSHGSPCFYHHCADISILPADAGGSSSGSNAGGSDASASTDASAGSNASTGSSGANATSGASGSSTTSGASATSGSTAMSGTTPTSGGSGSSATSGSSGSGGLAAAGGAGNGIASGAAADDAGAAGPTASGGGAGPGGCMVSGGEAPLFAYLGGIASLSALVRRRRHHKRGANRVRQDAFRQRSPND